MTAKQCNETAVKRIKELVAKFGVPVVVSEVGVKTFENETQAASVLFEFVFGIKPDAQNNTIRWHIDLTDRFGVENYPFGKDATLSLICEERGDVSDEPVVHIASDRPVTVEIIWNNTPWWVLLILLAVVIAIGLEVLRWRKKWLAYGSSCRHCSCCE